MNEKLSCLITEGLNPDTKDIDECSTQQILELINQEDHKVPEAVKEEIPQIAKAVELLYQALKKGGRMIYVGAGTSGRLGVLDASECPPTYGTSPEQVQGYVAGGDAALRNAAEGCEDNPQLGIDQIEQCKVSKKDVVVGITASGSAAYVTGALKRAAELGAGTIGVVNNKGSRLEQLCDVCIAPVCGPEVISGSTRMKAGTSQKLVLNMLTTTVMIKLGKVYGNRMVDVKASNKKLKERSIRMIQEIAGVNGTIAEEYLLKADGSAKLAVMCLLSGCEAEEGRRRLQKNDGYLKKALNAE